MSFFIRGKDNGTVPAKKGAPAKRKRPGVAARVNNSTSKQRKTKGSKVEISSDSEIESDVESRPVAQQGKESGEEEEEETAQEKRLRLTKLYLQQLEEEEADKLDLDEGKKEAVSLRLKEDVLEQAGKLQRRVAEDYESPLEGDIRILRGHKLPITCLVISPDDNYIFTGSKDCSVIKWSVETGKKLHVIPGGRSGTEATHVGHTAHVLALAISTDNKFLASGCRNRTIHIWKPDTCERVHTFSGHKDAVSGLVFRKGTHDLYSASFDRSVKIWNLDEMAYVETLFGHQDHVTGIDALSRERVLTSGGRDGSVRVWKVVEESQLVFHGHSGSIDCVQLINEEHFISGSDDGSVALWSVMKKKPSCLVKRAHSRFDDDDADNNNAESSEEAKWIGAVAALHSTDLVASGSSDGYVRLWQCSEGYRSLTLLHKIPVVGFVNALRFASSGDFIVAGVGQEHRLGRWWRRRDARNSVCIVPLKRTSTKQA